MPLDESRNAVNNLVQGSLEVFTDTHQWNARGRPVVAQWLTDLHAWEDDETFDRAFRDNRMTIRGIGKPESATNDSWKKGGIVTFGTNTEHGERGSQMKLYKGMDGMTERLKPAHFLPTVLPNSVQPKQKYALGLHDLSATLLNCAKGIHGQYKHYDPAIWVFMPLPKQEDLQAFYALNQRTKQPGACDEFKRYVRVLASEITRLKLAQACDMHTTYIDVAGLDHYQPPKATDKVSIRYGLTGLGQKKMVGDLVLHTATSSLDEPKAPTDGRGRFIISARKSDAKLAQVLKFYAYEARPANRVELAKKSDTEQALKNVSLNEKQTWGKNIEELRALLLRAWTPGTGFDQRRLDQSAEDTILESAAKIIQYRMSKDVPGSNTLNADRRRFALEYKAIVTTHRLVGQVNEIVMAYRRHGSGVRRTPFPMYAELDTTTHIFHVIGDNLTRTGATISNMGVYTGV